MKKVFAFILSLVLTLFLSQNTYGQSCPASENFANIPTTNTTNYLSRSWTGTDGVTWTATNARTDQTITGKAICTNGSGTVTSPTYSGGIGTLSFNYVRAFTGTSARSIQVWINGTQFGSTITVSTTSNTVVAYSQPVNISGNIVLELRTSGAQIKIDDIAWTCNCTNAGITSATAGDNSLCPSETTSITANGVVGTNAALTWWTAAGGTGTNLGTANPLTGQGAGTYYARVTADCGSAVETSVVVSSVSAPSTSAISGNASPACNAVGIGYSVTNTSGSTYSWTVPSGATITSGAGTSAITVSFGISNGNITVQETNNNGCLVSTLVTPSITVRTTVDCPTELYITA
jgi:PKD-like domain